MTKTYDHVCPPPPAFGWTPPDERTAEQTADDAAFTAAAPEFRIDGNYRTDSRKVALYEARRTLLGTKDLPYFWQVIGSCVGAGGGNMLLTLQGVEILAGDLEDLKTPWWLYTYGESRDIAGYRTKGGGSYGSAWAKAITERGVFPADVEGLPQYKLSQGWYRLTAGIETDWSLGAAEKWDTLAAEHLVKTASKARSADDIAAGIQNGYPATIASMFGTRGTRVLGGDEPVHVAEWDSKWAHQMFVDAWWDHPTLGELFRIGNNWGRDYHGTPADDSPAGGFWVRKKTMDQITQDDCWIFSTFNGFPARKLDWNPFD